MVNRPAFKLPAAIQRSAESGRKRPASGAPLRRVLGSKRLHYFTASTSSRWQARLLNTGCCAAD
jgi:hypothetical protein